MKPPYICVKNNRLIPIREYTFKTSFSETKGHEKTLEAVTEPFLYQQSHGIILDYIVLPFMKLRGFIQDSKIYTELTQESILTSRDYPREGPDINSIRYSIKEKTVFRITDIEFIENKEEIKPEKQKARCFYF